MKTKVPTLFKYFPDLRETIPWVDLETTEAPVHRLVHLGHDNLWIKRNDRISSVYGGNKVQRLEFVLGDALKRGKKKVVTLGGIGSNHCLATAIFCRRLGLSCAFSLFAQPLTRLVQDNLLLLYRNNAELTFFKNIPMAAVDYYLIKKWTCPGGYFIPSGGSSLLGILGAVSAALELNDQIHRGLMPTPRFVFYPTASNGGLAGLSLGLLLAGLETTVIGVRTGASHLFGMALNTPGTVKKAMKRTHAFLKSRSRQIPDIRIPEPIVLNDYCGGGYGCPTPAGRHAMKLFWEKEMILLEPVYTAKACAALLDFVRARPASAETVLYWHTFNSVDLSGEAASMDFHDLPTIFHPFFS